MSILYSAYVVCGFKLDILVVNTEQTKYNGDTGQPYKVKVPSHVLACVDGRPVIDSRDNPDTLCCGETFEGMEIIESGYECGTKVLGAVLACASEYKGDLHEVSVTVPDAVSQFAQRHGLTVKWFLIQSCG
jgi:hypothetical protein